MRVLIVDDHEFVRRGVRSLLLTQPTCEICGEAVNGQDALDKARQLLPDIIIMDISMPTLNGLEATREVRSSLPACGVIMLSQHESAEMVRQAFKAGARGYVVKSSVTKELLKALDKISRGDTYVDSNVSGITNPAALLESEELRKAKLKPPVPVTD
jgi:DNA-binding NarL/FixJ family response regulator